MWIPMIGWNNFYNFIMAAVVSIINSQLMYIIETNLIRVS